MILRVFFVLLGSLGILLSVGCSHERQIEGSIAGGDAKSKVAFSIPANEDKNLKSEEWLSHGRTYAEERYAPFTSINTENISDLGLEWSFEFGTSRGIEATPIVLDGVMYATSTWNLVHALDAKSGVHLWTYDPEVDRSRGAFLCCDAVNRGVAIWENQVFVATIDGRLIALDSKSGKVNWDVLTIDKSRPYTITGAPRVINGKVIIGNGGAEFGVRGFVAAYDVNDGSQLWKFYTVPGDPADGFESDAMKLAASTWNGEWWKIGGGGTVWDSMAYDPELNLLYIGVGNGSPWNQELRSPGGGDNLFLSSIVALNPDSGDYVWHYQTTPGDTWDFTATQHMVLADIPVKGVMRKVIMQAPKNGFFYVIDRTNGEFISAKNYVSVNWATHIDEDGRPVEVEEARWPGKQPYLQLPGPYGAHNWHPMSYSLDSGLVYIPAQEIPFPYADDKEFKYAPGKWNTGADIGLASLPEDKSQEEAFFKSVKGRIVAWDPVKQEQAWAFEHPAPWNGGLLSTGGNLVFQGTADAHFAAYNAKTGQRLWKYFTQTGIVAAPISYVIDGQQYVAIATGWGGVFALTHGGVTNLSTQKQTGRILVFKLDGQSSLTDSRIKESGDVSTIVPEIKADLSDSDIASGKANYNQHCLGCHGDRAISSGLVPDLRKSKILSNSAAWKAIVHDGGLRPMGMPSFADVLSTEDVEAIRAYILSEARSLSD